MTAIIYHQIPMEIQINYKAAIQLLMANAGFTPQPVILTPHQVSALVIVNELLRNRDNTEIRFTSAETAEYHWKRCMDSTCVICNNMPTADYFQTP